MTYSSSRFAHLTGVTIKTLRHYEQLGLLTPRRTDAGHRRYSGHEVHRLERVLALRSLGFPLDRIRTMGRDASAFLSGHRQRLEQKRAALDRAISVVTRLEGEANLTDAMNRFVADAAWDRWEARRCNQAARIERAPDRVREEKIALFQEILSAIERDVSAVEARRLAARSETVLDPGTLAFCRRRAAWPSGLREYVASLFRLSPADWERAIVFLETNSRETSQP